MAYGYHNNIISCHTDPSIPDVAGTFSGCKAQIGGWSDVVGFSEESENAGWFVQPIIFHFVAFFGRIFKTCLSLYSP